MNTRSNAGRSLKQESSDAGSPLRGDQVPPLEEDANVDQAMTNPPPLTDRDIRHSLIQLV